MAQRQPSFKQCVTADHSRGFAPKMIGSKPEAEFAGPAARRDGRRAWCDGAKRRAQAAVDFAPAIMRT